jgi:hypothetical protein
LGISVHNLSITCKWVSEKTSSRQLGENKRRWQGLVLAMDLDEQDPRIGHRDQERENNTHYEPIESAYSPSHHANTRDHDR